MNVSLTRMLSWFVLLAVVGAMAYGCRRSSEDYDLVDEQNPVFQKASRKLQEEDFQGAIEGYREALRASPASAKAHLQLGMIYDDVYTNRVRAIYHYERYLEKRPDTEKRELIEGWIGQLRRELAAGAALSSNRSDEILQLQQEVVQLRREVQELRLDRQRLREALQESSELPPEMARQPRGGPEQPGAGTQPQMVRSYTVVAGDTLQGISRKVYGTATHWREIFEANRDRIERPERLALGTVLQIPDL